MKLIHISYVQVFSVNVDFHVLIMDVPAFSIYLVGFVADFTGFQKSWSRREPQGPLRSEYGKKSIQGKESFKDSAYCHMESNMRYRSCGLLTKKWKYLIPSDWSILFSFEWLHWDNKGIPDSNRWSFNSHNFMVIPMQHVLNS